MHRVKALAIDLSREELEEVASFALSHVGNDSEAARWFLLHASSWRDDVPYVPREPSEYQV